MQLDAQRQKDEVQAAMARRAAWMEDEAIVNEYDIFVASHGSFDTSVQTRGDIHSAGAAGAGSRVRVYAGAALTSLASV